MNKNFNILEYFRHNALNNPGHECLIHEGRRLTYGEVEKKSHSLANSLLKKGVKPGERVSVLGGNSIETIVSILACMYAQIVFIPVNFRLSKEELKYIFQDSDSAAVLTVGEELNLLASKALADAPSISVMSVEELLSTTNDSNQSETVLSYSPDHSDELYQMYTSGTTGNPKGVVNGNYQLIQEVFLNLLISPRYSSDKTSLLLTPLFHAVGLGHLFINLCCGRPSVILSQFDPLKTLKIIESEKIADTIVVPTMLSALLAAHNKEPDIDVSSLGRVVYGASPISSSLLIDAMKTFSSAQFIQGYGMTELSGGVVFLSAEDHLKAIDGQENILLSCGRPGPNVEAKIVDTDGNELGCNETGEILLRTNTLMNGYWKKPEATDKVINNGWYYTGDAGYIDEEGYIYIRDRLKDMVISGGENIYPVEVEKTLLNHPNIMDVAVIGIPDDEYGESLLAFCVLDSSHQELNQDELIDFCRPYLAGYKIPRQYQFLEALPRNANGKILKRELKAPYWSDSERQV